MPWKMPPYNTLFELYNPLHNFSKDEIDTLLTYKNDFYDADHLIIISREGIPASAGTGINTLFTYNTLAPIELIYEKSWKGNTGIVSFLTIVPNGSLWKPTTVFAHECSHSLGCAHEQGHPTIYYAKAYVNNEKQLNCLSKGARVTDWTRNRFSGPLSKVIKNNETITMGSDSINNVRHAQECLNLIWCATENHITRISIDPTTCGSGILHATTNNADTFQWKVISGDCSLGATTGKDVFYMANATATIQVIGWKKGKWYGDTAYIDIPAIEMSTTKATIQSGTYYILPSGDSITMNGTYTSTLKNRNGCDSIVTTVLTVITNTTDNKPNELSIIPNPSFSLFRIIGILDDDQVLIFDLMGHPVEIKRTQDQFDLSTQAAGIYYVCISQGRHITYHKLLKL